MIPVRRFLGVCNVYIPRGASGVLIAGRVLISPSITMLLLSCGGMCCLGGRGGGWGYFIFSVWFFWRGVYKMSLFPV